MKPPEFEYVSASSVDEVRHHLDEWGARGTILAGGQSLVPLMNFRMAQPECLIDINGVDELNVIELREETVRIGATVRQRDAEQSDLIAERCPLIGETLNHVGHPQIRNQGTVVGNLVHADPTSELPAVALMLEARFRLVNAAGERREVPAEDFFQTMFSTDVKSDELVTDVLIPVSSSSSGSSFQEVTQREGDFALAGAGALLDLDDDSKTIRDVRIGMTGVSDRPIRARKAEDLLRGEPPRRDLFERAGKLATEDETLAPPDDLHASAEYRRNVAGVLVEQVLTEASESAGITVGS